MPAEPISLNRWIAFAFAVVYWAGVWVQARRVRRRIGRSPNVKPRGRKEKLLWAGWFLVVSLWLTIPFIAGNEKLWPWTKFCPLLLQPAGTAVGIMLMAAGYGGTLWCYSAMGRNWRMGINRQERTTLITEGPFRFVRHPIYVFQIVMLAGLTLLLPILLSLLAISIHLLCVVIKTADEESFLVGVHGAEYQDYQSRTGKLVPKFPSKKRQ